MGAFWDRLGSNDELWFLTSDTVNLGSSRAFSGSKFGLDRTSDGGDMVPFQSISHLEAFQQFFDDDGWRNSRSFSLLTKFTRKRLSIRLFISSKKAQASPKRPHMTSSVDWQSLRSPKELQQRIEKRSLVRDDLTAHKITFQVRSDRITSPGLFTSGPNDLGSLEISSVVWQSLRSLIIENESKEEPDNIRVSPKCKQKASFGLDLVKSQALGFSNAIQST
jgi:hypothetical protein